LGKRPSLRRQQNQRRLLRAGVGRQHDLRGGEDRLRLEHHPAPAAKWRFVGDAMLAGGVVADVVQGDGQQAGRLRALQDAGVQVGRENLWEEREYVDAHASSMEGVGVDVKEREG
ncbi:hypothetical protein RZS08_07625, partial [Arthrospira platensis SPKY1]|nr:hypothetical protein [Arthrospira platensis SPKY1]